MSRTELREHIFNMLFRVEFNSIEEMEEQERLYFDLMGEVAEEDKDYILSKYRTIAEKRQEIDELLDDLTTGWKTGRMSRVDLTILRLATYELL